MLRICLKSSPLLPLRSGLLSTPIHQPLAIRFSGLKRGFSLNQPQTIGQKVFYGFGAFKAGGMPQGFGKALSSSLLAFAAIKAPFVSKRIITFARCEPVKGPSRVADPRSTEVAKLEPRELTTREVLSLFWELIKPDMLLLLATALTAVVTAFVNLRIPSAIGDLVNALNNLHKNAAGSMSISDFLSNWSVNTPALKLMGLFIADGLLSFLYVSIVSVFGENFAERLRKRLFDSVVRQDIYFFDINKSGDLLNRMTADVQDFKHSVKQSVSQGLKSGTQIIGGFVSLYLLSSKLTLLIGITLPLMYSVGSIYGRYLRYISTKTREADAKSAGIANECLSNVRTVRAFAMEDHESEGYSKSLAKSSELHKFLGTHISIFQSLTHLSFSGMFLMVLYFGGSLVSSGELTTGQLMSYLLSTQTLQRSMANIVVLFGKINRAIGAGGRVLYYIQLKPQYPLKGGATLPMIKGEVEFKNVHFQYPTRPDHVVLKNLNLVVPAGRIVALCGISGSGKSTLAALIERFYEPTGGEILLDGVPLSSLDASWLRSNIGYINQEPTLFGTSIIENIRYGRPGASDEEVFQAARLANAHNFIDSFPGKYKTMVGERGVTLSGGQRQRIAIARALLKDPRILILDEATSALDAESEALVQEALERLMKGRTVFIIAHRLSTIKNADIICLITQKHKNIVEKGTHDELLAKKGAYYSLYKQMQEEVDQFK